jgi:hypothetical protein
VAETVSPGDSAEIKLHKLYARTQKIRDLTYELRTEEEKKRENIKPLNNVEELIRNGYGSDWGAVASVLFAAAQHRHSSTSDRHPIRVFRWALAEGS